MMKNRWVQTSRAHCRYGAPALKSQGHISGAMLVHRLKPSGASGACHRRSSSASGSCCLRPLPGKPKIFFNSFFDLNLTKFNYFSQFIFIFGYPLHITKNLNKKTLKIEKITSRHSSIPSIFKNEGNLKNTTQEYQIFNFLGNNMTKLI